MDKNLYLVPKAQRPPWLEYPASFCRIVEQGLIHLDPWHIMEAERASVHAMGLAKRYPKRTLFPFAYSQDMDEVACWSDIDMKQVFVIHDFASEGWESGREFEDFWAWFRHAIDETIFWE